MLAVPNSGDHTCSPRAAHAFSAELRDGMGSARRIIPESASGLPGP